MAGGGASSIPGRGPGDLPAPVELPEGLGDGPDGLGMGALEPQGNDGPTCSSLGGILTPSVLPVVVAKVSLLQLLSVEFTHSPGLSLPRWKREGSLTPRAHTLHQAINTPS